MLRVELFDATAVNNNNTSVAANIVFESSSQSGTSDALARSTIDRQAVARKLMYFYLYSSRYLYTAR